MEQTLSSLKKLMSNATSVERWNELREEAKATYPQDLINQLDASGYITKVIKTNKVIQEDEQ